MRRAQVFVLGEKAEDESTFVELSSGERMQTLRGLGGKLLV